MGRDRATVERRVEAAACFAIGVAVAVAGSLGVQAVDAHRGGAPAAASGAAMVAVPEHRLVPPPAAVDDAVEIVDEEPATAPSYAAVAAPAPVAEPGERLGRFRFTLYYVVDETRSPSPASAGDVVTIYDDRDCQPIAALSRAFVRELDMEGTGRLRDGRTINVSSQDCRCGRSPCYRTMDRDARWGLGARGEPLEPFRTVAVDPDVIALGTHLYVPEIDGLTMPGPAPWGGFVHDGCVVAVDVGGRIHGRDVDFFAGREVYMKAFEARWNIKRITVHRADQRCGHARSRVARDSGS